MTNAEHHSIESCIATCSAIIGSILMCGSSNEHGGGAVLMLLVGGFIGLVIGMLVGGAVADLVWRYKFKQHHHEKYDRNIWAVSADKTKHLGDWCWGDVIYSTFSYDKIEHMKSKGIKYSTGV